MQINTVGAFSVLNASYWQSVSFNQLSLIVITIILFRYIQVGNAVAVPVARALGYALGLAYQDKSGDQPTFKLPPKFPDIESPKGEIESVEVTA